MEKVIVSGFGGQGVLFTGKLLAFTGMVTGRHVSWIPSYGPEMRGGTANCSVIISEKEITSPIVNSCTALLALNGPSLDKFQETVEADGRILFESSLIAEIPEKSTAEWISVPANDLARDLEAPGLMNMVMLGAFVRASSIITLEDVFKGMDEMLGGKRPELIMLNRKALQAGYHGRVGTYA